MDRIKETFRENRKKFYYLLVPVGVLVFAMVYLARENMIDTTSFIVLLFASLALGLWGNFRYWRCPSCDGSLGKLYIGLDHPKHCPECGVELIDTD